MKASTNSQSGCLDCGRPVIYLAAAREERCVYCQARQLTETLCEAGHFICDSCHTSDALKVIEQICRGSTERDLITLLEQIRSHPALHVHGPEHHALVPAVIVTAYRNTGGALPEGALGAAIERGGKVPGGFCGFAGSCGAAIGVGIGFSVVLEATPVRPRRRQAAQRASAAALAAVAERPAARCCQRDCWIALCSAAESSRELLPLALSAEAPLRCRQASSNKQCSGRACPLCSEEDDADHAPTL